MTQYCQGVPSGITSRLDEEKENTGVRFNGPATVLAIQHTMTNSSGKQQHGCCSNNSSILVGTDRAAAAAAALCMYAYETDLSIIVHIFTLGKKRRKNEKKQPSQVRTTDAEGSATAVYLLLHSFSYIHRLRLVCIYTYEQTHGTKYVYFDKENETASAARRRRQHG